jgi:predicted nucleotidyltransferase
MNPSPIELIRSIWPELQSLGVERLAVFGSAARGDGDETSDVDVLVRFRDRATLRGLVDLRDRLEALLGRDVDVLTEAAIESRPRLARRVREDAIDVA